MTENILVKVFEEEPMDEHSTSSYVWLANQHVLCAMGMPGEYYERGLLHPLLDYDQPQPWLREPIDSMDDQGYVHISQRPGLGLDIDFDYVREHTL